MYLFLLSEKLHLKGNKKNVFNVTIVKITWESSDQKEYVKNVDSMSQSVGYYR